MAPILVLAQIQIDGEDRTVLESYARNSREALAHLPGFLGMGVWRSVSSRSHHLIIWHYASAGDANTGLQALTESRILVQQTASSRPADVLRVCVTGTLGESIVKGPVGRYLSLSVRVAEPGYGVDLAQELERIFGELAFIDGFAGATFGPNETLDEEVIGIATWHDEAAFRRSLPSEVLYEIKLFRRII